MPASNNITIPEATVFQTVKAALHTLRNDYEEKIATPELTFLYRSIGVNNAIQGYNMFEQAKSVFLRPKNPNEPRFLDVSMGWDSDRVDKKMPHIHIIMQNDSPKDDSLGLGSGNFPPEFDDDNGTYSDFKVRRFNQQVNLLITGDNSNEKYLIYHVLKSILIQFIPYFEELGLQNVAFNGGDVQMRNDIAGLIYMRTLSIRYDYNLKSPSLDLNEFSRQIYLAIDKLNDDGTTTEIYNSNP